MPRLITRCSVKLCNHIQAVGGCVFSRFPTNVRLCKEWLQTLGDKTLLKRPFFDLINGQFVCSCHFKETDYRPWGVSKRIKTGAIPTVFEHPITPLTDKDLENFVFKNPQTGPRRKHTETIKKTITTTSIKVPLSELRNLVTISTSAHPNSIFIKTFSKFSPGHSKLQLVTSDMFPQLNTSQTSSLISNQDHSYLEDPLRLPDSEDGIKEEPH